MSNLDEQNNFMELGEALSIVYELGEQNALDPDDCDDEQVLREEALRQRIALDTVHDYIVNHHGEE